MFYDCFLQVLGIEIEWRSRKNILDSLGFHIQNFTSFPIYARLHGGVRADI